MKEILSAFIPNKSVTKSTAQIILWTQVALFLLVWATVPLPFVPSPGVTWTAFGAKWQQGLGESLLISLTSNLEAIIIASIISLSLAYLTVVEGIRPIIVFLSKLRFLSMIGLSFFFTVFSSSEHQLKVSLLVFSISVFFVTGMADVIKNIPKEQYDLARTLRMGPWRTVWEVVVLGQIDQAFDVLRQNAAIGWMMLTMVESMVMSEGGIGVLLIVENKHLYMPAIFAIQITILLTGLAQDYAICFLKKQACRYAAIGVERK